MGFHDAGTGLEDADTVLGAKLSDELTPGTIVGEYRVEKVIGEGGMGRVYAALHPVIAKRAAIKVLHPGLSAHPMAIERFVQEARSVNQIGHPNIVDIFSFGALPDGRHYFVMELLRGESLRERIARAPLALGEALQILDIVAIALEAAHEAGIVHRDLKPDNIFLAQVKGVGTQIKLLDFGIAKLLGNETIERTRTGNLMGTPAYMSPEQARGQGVDHRTDIYALGAVAYEMLTGELPFPADNAADMIAKSLFEPVPSVRARNPDIEPVLAALVTGMLAKTANERPSLADVRATLAMLPRTELPTRSSQPAMSYAPTLPPAVPTLAPPPARKRSGWLVVAALATVGVGIAGALWLMPRDEHSTTPAPAVSPPAADAGPTSDAMLPDASIVDAAVVVDAPAPVDAARPATTMPPRPTRPARPTRPTKPRDTKPPGPTPGSAYDPDAPM